MLKVAAPVLTLVLAGTGCVDIIGAGGQVAAYVEREEKRFTTTGKPDVHLGTFDGSIEIRPWDRSEVLVVVEKRASSKEVADEIQIKTEQTGNRVSIDVTVPKRNSLGITFNFSRSAKLIVSMPASSDVVARSGDGSIDIERITGRVELRSGDGSIVGRALGEVTAHTGDGSIRLENVNGALSATTGDGSIVVSGKLTALRARSGDGSVVIHAERGSAATSDWDIHTGDGSVTVDVPDGFNAEVDAHSGDGRVSASDLGISNPRRGEGRSHLRGRIGSGGSTLRVRTGDGSITLKRS